MIFDAFTAVMTTVIGILAGPSDTINEFLPEDRNLSDCISALPRPGCGSEARGGWRQWIIFVALLAGLGFIAWRIISAVRRGRPTPPGGDTTPPSP